VAAYGIQREISPRQVEHRNWLIIEITPEGENRYREVIKSAIDQPGAPESIVQERPGIFGVEEVSPLRRGTWHKTDANTIMRIADFPAHLATTTIKLASPSHCEAKLEIELKPGHTLFEGPRVMTGERMLMDVLRYERVTCLIKPNS
jgi:hypothetical protein